MNTIELSVEKIGFGKFHLYLLLTMGIVHSCDSMEMLILAYIGPILGCSWRINKIEASFITTTLFIGIIIGASILGKISDNYGRKTTLVISSLGLFYFGLLCSITPTIYWMILMRLLIGFFIGGNGSSLYAQLSELTPEKYRGTIMVLTQLFWAFGSYLITILSYLIVPAYGWRLFLIVSTFPIVIVSILLIWMPESPRYLLLHHRKLECLKVLNHIARINKSEFITDVHESPIQKSSIRDLFHKNYLKTTILICFMWFVAGLLYYGLVIIITIIHGLPHRCLQDMSKFSIIQSENQTKDDSCCFELTWESYKNNLISTTGEVVFIPISIILINLIGRKRTFSVYLTIISIGIVLLNLCLTNLQLNILLFFTRGSLKSYFNVNFIYATEVFPTSVRGFGVGICNVFSRIGAIISPFIVNIIIANHSFLGGTMTLFLLSVLALLVSFLLPYETKDRNLYQTADHDDVVYKDKKDYKTINKN